MASLCTTASGPHYEHHAFARLLMASHCGVPALMRSVSGQAGTKRREESERTRTDRFERSGTRKLIRDSIIDIHSQDYMEHSNSQS